MKMYNLILFILLFSSLAASAQHVDYNRIIAPESDEVTDFGEKLVRLAWANDPESEMVRQQVGVAESGVNLAGLDWLNTISLQGNLNEFNIDPDADNFNRSQFYPRYNLGIHIALGNLFTIPYQTRRSRQELAIAHTAVNQRKLALRAQVLRLYNTYRMEEQLYKLQTEISGDAEGAYKLAEDKFKNGQISFESYTATKSEYTQAQMQFYQTEAEYKNAKVDLEQLVGVSLEEVR